jgi:hypothetical protein
MAVGEYHLSDMYAAEIPVVGLGQVAPRVVLIPSLLLGGRATDFSVCSAWAETGIGDATAKRGIRSGYHER